LETSAGSSVAIDGPTLEKTPDPFSFCVIKKNFSDEEATAEVKSALTLLFLGVIVSSNLAWLLPKSENIAWWLQSLRYPSIALASVAALLNTRFLPLPKRLIGVTIWWTKHLWKEDRLFGFVLAMLLVKSLAELGYAFAFYPAFLLGLFLFYVGYSGFGSNRDKEETVKAKTNGLVYGLTCIGLSVYAYASLTYPLISPHFGGGKPLLVSLSLKPEHRQTMGQIMGREDWNCVMHNISLIHENSELIYVLPHGYLANESAIAIPKSALVSIVYQKKEKSEHSTCLEKG